MSIAYLRPSEPLRGRSRRASGIGLWGRFVPSYSMLRPAVCEVSGFTWGSKHRFVAGRLNLIPECVFPADWRGFSCSGSILAVPAADAQSRDSIAGRAPVFCAGRTLPDGFGVPARHARRTPLVQLACARRVPRLAPGPYPACSTSAGVRYPSALRGRLFRCPCTFATSSDGTC